MLRRHALALALCASLAPAGAGADPPVGAALPTFGVDDLTGQRHTQRDLLGNWSVLLVMTDKDVGPDLTSWWRRLEPRLPAGARMYTFCAVNLFPLIPTATIVSQARDSTPRNRWSTVWLSRDGSLARAFGLPEDETPWVLVIDPQGRVAANLHERVSDAALERVVAMLAPAPERVDR